MGTTFNTSLTCVDLTSAEIDTIITNSDLFLDFYQWFTKRHVRFANLDYTKVFLSYMLSANTPDRIRIRAFCKLLSYDYIDHAEVFYLSDIADEFIYDDSSDQDYIDQHVIDNDLTDLPF